MKQAVLREPGVFELVEAPVPEPAAGELLVRVAACGVCASELDMFTGHTERSFPLLPGHEVSGIVERVGAGVTRRRPGDRVGIWVTEAGFSEYVTVDSAFALPAGDMPLDLALAEPVACAVNAVDIADVRLGDDVAIVGAGFMGALVLKLVLMRGPRRVFVADTRPEALERARAIGATHVIDVRSESLADAVRANTDRVPPGTFGGVDPVDETGADVTFEVTGVQAPLRDAGEATRMAGKLVVVGYHQGGSREIPLGDWNWKALQLVNAHFREIATIMRGMRTGMRLLSSGRLQIDDLVTHRFRIDQVGEAFQVAVDKPAGFVKSTVVIGGE
ncbi:MAG TPA: alcohol dehydrogenase catalytic domain-containing protein [Gaiellales bacterium]|jgi:threonine dehydrogenase-like Zn-dependent dehydrogenase|nr:alcohol dehydrogenase catalytic domain-containing protein [Gaiellales bacterium]